MGQRTAIIIQKIYSARDNFGKGQNGGYVIGATFGFYCQWGLDVFLFRDINDLLQRVRMRDRFLDVGHYTCMPATEKIIKPEYYSIVDADSGFREASTLRHIVDNKKNKSTKSNKDIMETLMRIYCAHEKFLDTWGREASYPYMDYLDIWISKRIDNIDENNLWQYIPMEDFRDNAKCRKYFERFMNNDGGALITQYGGQDYRPDICECRIIDGRDKYGEFVSPDYYIQQYIDEADKKSHKNWMKKNYKNFVKLIEEFQKCKIIKDY